MTEVVRPDRSAAAARAVAHAGPSPWQQLAQLQQRALAANRVAELAFIAVNETWQLMPYRQAVLWRFDARDRPALQAVSGLARLAEESPNTIWLKRLGRWLARRVGADRPEGGEAGATSAAGVGAGVGASGLFVGAADLPAVLAADWPAFMSAVGWVLPLRAPRGGRLLGLLMFALEVRPDERQAERVAQAVSVYGHAWAALVGAAGTSRARPRRLRVVGWGVAVLALASLAVPVRLSVLAPAEVIALDAVAVTAPMDGVVRAFAVQPNQSVARDALLFTLDDTTLRNRREVAQRQLQVARAEALAAAQKSFASDASRAELAALNGRVAERQAELGWLDEQLRRIEVRAPAAGVVVFGDVNDWVGKPLVTGERVALLADPADAGVLIWLPVAEALDIEPGAEVRLFLQTAPLSPLAARLSQTSYQSVLSPDGVASYRLRARFDPAGSAAGSGPPPAARIGLKGTAKLYGAQAPLGYYLFRRPLAALRAFAGW